MSSCAPIGGEVAASASTSMCAAAAAALPPNTPAQPATQPITRLLSIQSSVVYGYVGNKSSNFPLQLLGYDVDPIHSCQFSNHTGHPHFSGYKTTGEDLKQITKGLRLNQFLQQYTLLLTGYMGSVEFLEESVNLIREMKEARPDLVYACDPVLGDNNALYVPEAFVPIYRDKLLHLSDIVTPNQTEAERLSGITIRDLQSAYTSLQWFHARGVRTVIITSMTFAGSDDRIEVLASTLSDLSDPYPTQVARMSFEKVPTYFSGTGDLTTAMLLGWIVKKKGEEATSTTAPGVFSFPTLVCALELTMSTLQSVIHRTAAAKSEELLLIQSKSEIERPHVTQRAEIVDATQWAQQLKQQHASTQ